MDPQFSSISNTALSNDKWLCVREVTQTESNVVIVDLQNGNNVTKHKMKADAAVMHPSRNVIALKGSNVIQIFDLGQRAKLKSYNLPEGVVVNYWRWLDDDTLAFIAGSGVFHWSLSVDQPPIGVFQLNGPVASGSVMSYCVSHDQMWLAVFALTREENGAPAGKIQLYSKERNISQVIDAFTAGFSHYGDLPLLIFVTHGPTGNKVNIFPLGNSPAAQQFGRRAVDLPAAPDAAAPVNQSRQY